METENRGIFRKGSRFM